MRLPFMFAALEVSYLLPLFLHLWAYTWSKQTARRGGRGARAERLQGSRAFPQTRRVFELCASTRTLRLATQGRSQQPRQNDL